MNVDRPESGDDHPDASVLATDMLAELFRRHGCPARVEDGTIHVAPPSLRVECRVPRRNLNPSGVTAQVDVRFWTSLDPLHPIDTPLAGWGPNMTAAIHKALTDWFHRILEPVREALDSDGKASRGQMTATTEETGRTTVWDIFEGPIEVVAAGADKQILLRHATGEGWPLPFVVDALTGVVGSYPGRPLHWAKLYLAREVDGNRMTECQIDNVDWEHDLDKLQSYPWPDQTGYMAVKYFVVLRRTSPPLDAAW